MDTIIRNIRDIDSGERRVLERVLGRPLRENQQVIVQIVTLEKVNDGHGPVDSGPTNELPEWCRVFAGLTDDQIAEVEKVILPRANLSRSHE